MDTGIGRLQVVLETYGGDPSRWPGAERAALEHLAREDPRGRRLLAEAQALDRLLDLAPAAEAGQVGALADRILARAEDGRGELPVHLAPRARRAGVDGLWKVAGVLAASLVLGVYLGASGLALPTLEQLDAGVTAATGSGVLADVAASEDLASEEGLL